MTGCVWFDWYGYVTGLCVKVTDWNRLRSCVYGAVWMLLPMNFVRFLCCESAVVVLLNWNVSRNELACGFEGI